MSIKEEMLSETGGLQRARLWESLGYPMSPPHMDQAKYEREYATRQTFVNRQVFYQAERLLRTVFCPSCIVEDAGGRITGVRLYAQVEDDVMTTFKAMGHFTCHHCGFDEYHPLAKDPRVNEAQSGKPGYMREIEELEKQRRRYEAMQRQAAPTIFGGVLAGSVPQGGGLLGQAADQRLFEDMLLKRMEEMGETPAKSVSPIPGAIESEQAALQRLVDYAAKERAKKKAP